MPLPLRNFLLTSLFPLLFAPNATAGRFDPESLVGTDYLSARKKLIKEGWAPVRYIDPQLMDREKKIQRKFPELDSCAIDKPVCSLSYRKQGKCLRVITWGEDMKSFEVNAIAHDCSNDGKR